MENQANDLNLKPTKSQLFQRKASHDSGINRSPMSNKIIINLNTLLSNDKTLFSKAFPIRTPSKPEIRTPDSLTFYNYKFKDFIPPMSTVNVKKLINEEKNEQTTNSKSLLNKLKLLNQRPSISQQKRRKSLATNQIIKTNISNIETNTDITNHRKTFSMIGGVSPNKNGQKSKFIEMKKGVFHKNKGNNIKANKSVASNCSSINASIGMKKIEDKEKINKISDKIDKAIYSKNIIEDV